MNGVWSRHAGTSDKVVARNGSFWLLPDLAPWGSASYAALTRAASAGRMATD